MAAFDPFTSFETLANDGRPTAGGSFFLSPTGGLLGRLLTPMGGGLLSRYDAVGGWPGESPPNDVATALAPTPHPALPSPPALLQDQSSGAFPGGLGNWLGRNSATLMGLGAGIAGGKSWGEGLSKGLQNAMSGRALDQQRAAHNQTVAALMNRGLDETTARAAAGNPAMLRAVLLQLYPQLARSSWSRSAAPSNHSDAGSLTARRLAAGASASRTGVDPMTDQSSPFDVSTRAPRRVPARLAVRWMESPNGGAIGLPDPLWSRGYSHWMEPLLPVPSAGASGILGNLGAELDGPPWFNPGPELKSIMPWPAWLRPVAPGAPFARPPTLALPIPASAPMSGMDRWPAQLPSDPSPPTAPWDDRWAGRETAASQSNDLDASVPRVEHLDSAKYWGAASSRASTESMPASGGYLSPMPQPPSWPELASVSASQQWTVPQTTPPVGSAAPAMAFSGTENGAPSVSPPQASNSGDDVGDRGGSGPAEQAQQRPDTLSPQEIENICKLDPARIAADFANRLMPMLGRRDPMTGQVVTLEWIKQQAQQMQQMTEQIQREFRCAPI